MGEDRRESLRKELKEARKRVRELEDKIGLYHAPEDAEELIKMTLEQMHEGLQIIDRSYRYAFLNGAAVRHGHTEKHQLLGRTMMECYPGIEKTEMYAVLQSVMNTRKPRQMENFFEYPDGSKCWFEIFLEPHALGVLIRSFEITSRKQLEEQYLHSQRMESVGHLAGGIAHDFNNKLGVMTLYCEMLLEEAPKDSKNREYLEYVLGTIEDASALTQQLLAYGRRQVLDLQVVNLNDIVQRLNKSLPKLLGSKIEIRTALDSELSNVRVDPSQVDQILLNLCINARDAMPEGGILTIETSHVEIDEVYCADHAEVMPGDYVMLSLSDTGTGMTPEVQSKIFDPFFTTKPIGKGTGLGLASVHGIVRQSRGHIWVYSEEGLGTTFKIYFPQVQDAAKALSDKKVPADLSGTERILLVEDDELLLNAFSLALAKAGYSVTACQTGQEAKAHFMQEKGQYDLLLTDVVFPDSTGPKLSEELKALNSNLKTVLVSGYTQNTVLHHNSNGQGLVLIQKPVSTYRLLSTLRQVLNGSLVRGVI